MTIVVKCNIFVDLRILSILLGLAILLSGCEKKFDEYYKVPDDLIGTILDVLEEEGDYTQFIKSVELVEFDDVLGKTGNFTVFAPNDDAFSEFQQEYGHTKGAQHMGHMRYPQTEWMHHLADDHEDDDKHFGEFNMEDGFFMFSFRMVEGFTPYFLNFQGVKD